VHVLDHDAAPARLARAVDLLLHLWNSG
jgi:hypothetical protein